MLIGRHQFPVNSKINFILPEIYAQPLPVVALNKS